MYVVFKDKPHPGEIMHHYWYTFVAKLENVVYPLNGAVFKLRKIKEIKTVWTEEEE